MESPPQALSRLYTPAPPGDPESTWNQDRTALRQGSCFRQVAGYSSEGFITLPAFSLPDGMATVSKLSCDDYLQGPVKLLKMRLLWLEGYPI